jgi:F420 biosynthesis protein FbiB-like protein
LKLGVVSLDGLQVLLSRRSIRRFKPSKLSRELVLKIIDLGRWAPSAHNAQPWRFVIIDDERVKKKLAVEMGKAWVSDLLKNGFSRDVAEEIVKTKSWERIAKAPVIIIACLTLEEMHQYSDQRRKKAEYIMGVQSVAAALQNILLAAHYHGLGACWICAPLFCQDVVRSVLQLPEEFEPQAMIILGYPDEEVHPPPRKSLREIANFNSWL